MTTMDPASFYKDSAERCLEQGDNSIIGSPEAEHFHTRAQVFATLAVAAATEQRK